MHEKSNSRWAKRGRERYKGVHLNFWEFHRTFFPVEQRVPSSHWLCTNRKCNRFLFQGGKEDDGRIVENPNYSEWMMGEKDPFLWKPWYLHTHFWSCPPTKVGCYSFFITWLTHPIFQPLFPETKALIFQMNPYYSSIGIMCPHILVSFKSVRIDVWWKKLMYQKSTKARIDESKN